MKKEDVTVLAHLLTSLKDSTESLEKGLKNKDNEEIILSKREIMKIQSEIKRYLSK